jgi:hypothetical protein
LPRFLIAKARAKEFIPAEIVVAVAKTGGNYETISKRNHGTSRTCLQLGCPFYQRYGCGRIEFSEDPQAEQTALHIVMLQYADQTFSFEQAQVEAILSWSSNP